jgi:hypothetical protein
LSEEAKSDEETFAMFESFMKESQRDESQSLFKDIGFEIDPEMHKLVIKSELIAGIPSLSFLNLISTHSFELSELQLESTPVTIDDSDTAQHIIN